MLFFVVVFFIRYDYRLKYFNLKKARSQNAINIEDMQKLWIPFLVFDNTEKNEATWVEDHISHILVYAYQGTRDTELTLTREGDFVRSSDQNVEEINIFDGKLNRISFEQVYAKIFKCTYQLQLYPFDTQVNKQS